jgi:hypothetical protein
MLAGDAPAGAVGAPAAGGAPPARSPASAPRTPPSEPEPAPPSGAKAQLADALAAMDEHTLAARVGMAAEVVSVGDELVVRLTAVPPATVQSLRDAGERLAAAARAAGLPARVRVEGGVDGSASAPGVRARVEADEAVQRVLRTFGGRIESVEEQT